MAFLTLLLHSGVFFYPTELQLLVVYSSKPTLFLKRNATFWKLPFFLEVAFLFGEECIPVNLGLHDPDPGPQEKSMKKSCVSFETECISHCFCRAKELWGQKRFLFAVYASFFTMP